MPKLGHEPADNARGNGRLLGNRAKATYIGGFSTGVWVTEMGVRVGKYGAANGVVSPAVWDWNPAGVGSPAALIHAPAPQTITAVMRDNAGGKNYRWQIHNLPLAANRKMAIGLWNDDGAGEVMYGQSNSGARMYRDNNAPSVPNPFNNDQNSPEGNIDAWITAVENVKPVVSIVDPLEGAATDDTPTIKIRYTDPNAAQGDYIAQYRIEIWDQHNTTRLESSGILNTNGTQQTNGELTWTAPQLDAGDYTIRAYVYDRLGLVSSPATRRFTVAPGGTFSAMAVSGVVGQNPDGVDVITTNIPTLSATWEHEDGLHLETVEVQITGGISGGVVRGPVVHPVFPTLAPGAVFVFGFTSPNPDWTALSASLFPYRYQIRGTDVDGGTTPWTVSDAFFVNSPPTQPTDHIPPSGTTVTNNPMLSAVAQDTNDGAPSLQGVAFEVEHVGSGDILQVPGVYLGQGRWIETPSIPDQVVKNLWYSTHGLGTYRWRMIGTDPWGAPFTPADTWHTLNKVAPPDITMVYPTDGQTIPTGTPMVDYTVDRTQTHHRLRITRNSDGANLWDSKLIATSATQLAIPAGLLGNGAYTGRLTVRTSDGLESSETFGFTVSYPQPPALANVSITQEQSSVYDSPGLGMPGQTPNVRIIHDRVSEAQVPVDEWEGYRWERISQSGEVTRWVQMDRDATEFVDTLTENDAYTYRGYYVQTVNDGADTVQSVPVEEVEAITIRYAVLRSVNPDDPAITLHYWDDRGDQDDPDTVSIQGWEEKPIVFQGPKDAMDISGRFEVWDHPDNLYRARDLLADLRNMKRPEVLPDNVHRPRQYFYTDPMNRSAFVRITRLRVRDQHESWRIVFDLDLEEFGQRGEEE